MRRLGQLLNTPFGLAVLGCLVLAGWALWSGGVLDGPIARQVRSSSVYAAPDVELDQAAAERIIGNRRLVVVFLAPGADLGDGCDSVKRAADGTVVLLLSRDGDEFDTYGCALLPDRDDENFGRAYVAESMISRGIDGFVDRPLEALKVIAVNYDRLVRAGTVPDGARTISPSLPRFLVAASAVVAVVVGSALVYLVARRAGRRAAASRERRTATADGRSALTAATAVLAQQIIDLDQRYAASGWPANVGPAGARQREFANRYQKVASDYADLLDAVTAARDGEPAEISALTKRVEALSSRCRSLTMR